MTGSVPVLDRPALWAALSHMQIELPCASARFEKALAEGQGWTLGFARRVTDEYRKFLYLAATAGFEVTPSQPVDEAWHLHLTSPHYREKLCERILGRSLDHRPGTGDPQDEARYRLQYEETLASYQRVFGRPPPADIWPDPLPEEEAEIPTTAWRRIRRLGRGIALGNLVGAMAASALGAPGIGFALAVAALLFFLFSQTPAAAGGLLCRPGACGGGGGGGGGGGTTDNCGSSCGGASCGGGGCGGD